MVKVRAAVSEKLTAAVTETLKPLFSSSQFSFLRAPPSAGKPVTLTVQGDVYISVTPQRYSCCWVNVGVDLVIGTVHLVIGIVHVVMGTVRIVIRAVHVVTGTVHIVIGTVDVVFGTVQVTSILIIQ